MSTTGDAGRPRTPFEIVNGVQNGSKDTADSADKYVVPDLF